MSKNRRRHRQPRIKTPAGTELRYNEDGTVDEIIINRNGECIFHLEQMDDGHYWSALGTGQERVDINFHSDSPISARAEAVPE